jgi:hypothetical protein
MIMMLSQSDSCNHFDSISDEMQIQASRADAAMESVVKRIEWNCRFERTTPIAPKILLCLTLRTLSV